MKLQTIKNYVHGAILILMVVGIIGGGAFIFMQSGCDKGERRLDYHGCVEKGWIDGTVYNAIKKHHSDDTRVDLNTIYMETEFGAGEIRSALKRLQQDGHITCWSEGGWNSPTYCVPRDAQ